MTPTKRIVTALLVLCVLSATIRCVAREPDTAAVRLILQAGKACGVPAAYGMPRRYATAVAHGIL